MNARFKVHAITALIVGALGVCAAPIPGLVSTGGSAPGTPDPAWYWSYVPSPPAGTFVPAYVTDDTSYPFPHWVANSAQSKWISPQQGYGPAYGAYTDQVGFHYFAIGYYIGPGYDPDTATFQFMLATDNNLNSIWVNGTQLTGINAAGYTALQGPYTVGPSPGLFQAGWNSMVVVIENEFIAPFDVANNSTWNPVGIRVEIVSSFIEGGPPSEIPEPAVLYMYGAGLLAIGFLRTKRRT